MGERSARPSAWSRAHVAALAAALEGLDGALVTVERWGATLAAGLAGTGRLLVAGNGGSAALAEHLAAELVGRFFRDRRGLDAQALTTDGSIVTAVANDFGARDVFARQVQAHAHAGDVVLFLSTSGSSPNLLVAAEAARDLGVTTWAMTGPAPNALATLCDAAVCIDAGAATVQEVQQLLVHVLARAVDEASIVGEAV
ncbi:MAG TPA: SIS domain-containing protein [Acidimicrobiales bacterium]|nr:SIS domain-containing protein [Acidimicrobiales bacterium]